MRRPRPPDAGSRRRRHVFSLAASAALCLEPLDAAVASATASGSFQVEEATIAGIQDAIRSGATTCAQVVEAYVARARAYNGACTALVTPDGKPVAPVRGAVRAGSAVLFPTRTVKAAAIFPQLDQYHGVPLDYGRMERTLSDPAVYAQMGMRVGLPDAGQVNALETLNLRGERSVTCKGALDAPPSSGPLPSGAPVECERLRQLPDAREQAAALDARYGTHPDVATLPMYCAVVAFKDVYDTRDMRTTANNDVDFAMDVPPTDATVVGRLRDKGAIIYAKSVAHEFNGGPGTPGGPEKEKTHLVAGGQGMGAWAGQPCNPYDTERVVRGSSSGSGAAIAANLATVGICEQSGASCQGPASRNGIVTLLTTKGLTPDSGGIGYQWINDRAGIHARTLPDAARVLDALKDPVRGYYDPHDPFTALPRGLIAPDGYASAVFTDAMLQATPRPLQGVRIAIVREHMVHVTPNHKAISEQLDGEIKRVLRDQLGADLVETEAAGYPDDPAIPNLAFSFNDALAELLPRFMPEIFKRRDGKGALWFDVPGHDVTSYDYLQKLVRHEAPLTRRVNITNFATFAAANCQPSLCPDTVFDLDRYLQERGDARIRSWADWVAHAKFRDDAGRAGAVNWLAFKDHLRDGKSDTLARSVVARLALQMVMERNGIAAFVHPENTVPTPKIQGANVGSISLDGITPFFQVPKIAVPAGFTDVIVEPSYALNEAHTDYVSVIAPGTVETRLKHPLPISLTLFAGPGDERTLIRIGTAYEAATHHRAPPPAFGPVTAARPATSRR